MPSEVHPPSMTWPQFAATNLELADFGAARLKASPAYLATIRVDGSPRVHPVSPIIAPSGLYVFMEPSSPKAADIRDRARFALHCGSPEARYILFELRLDEARANGYGDVALPAQPRWTAADA